MWFPETHRKCVLANEILHILPASFVLTNVSVLLCHLIGSCKLLYASQYGCITFLSWDFVVVVCFVLYFSCVSSLFPIICCLIWSWINFSANCTVTPYVLFILLYFSIYLGLYLPLICLSSVITYHHHLSTYFLFI